MTLKGRIISTLAVLVFLLVLPAIYGVFALRELSNIAYQLQTRDAVASLALGRLQAAVGEVEHWQRIYVAVPSEDPARRVDRGLQAAEEELRRLEQAGYREAAAVTRERWNELRDAVATERELVEEGETGQVEVHRAERVSPAFTAMHESLDPLSVAIDRGGTEQVARAQGVASGAATTTLVALLISLIAGLILAGWLTQTLLRPIHELRRGMGVVSEGNFEPDVAVPTHRSDELGDLARSFNSMTAQLAELERLKAEFISVGSHELKTPLSVIQGYASLLLEGLYGEIDEEQRDALNAIKSQTARLTQMVQQLLDISRFEAGGMRLDCRPLQLPAFLKELASGFQPLAHQNQIDFRLDIDPDLPAEVTADAERLNEVLGNLLSNAFKFTPRGGTIDFRAAPRDGSVHIEVEDSGVGIPEQHLVKIFEKFYQVDNPAQPRSAGSGLGLAIAKELIEAHGGTIAAESKEGSGTRFWVTLPKEVAVSGHPSHPTGPAEK